MNGKLIILKANQDIGFEKIEVRKLKSVFLLGLMVSIFKLVFVIIANKSQLPSIFMQGRQGLIFRVNLELNSQQLFESLGDAIVGGVLYHFKLLRPQK